MLLLRGTGIKVRLAPARTLHSVPTTSTEFRVSCLPVRSGSGVLHSPLSLLRAHPYRSTQQGHWQEPTAKFSSCRSAPHHYRSRTGEHYSGIARRVKAQFRSDTPATTLPTPEPASAPVPPPLQGRSGLPACTPPETSTRPVPRPR